MPIEQPTKSIKPADGRRVRHHGSSRLLKPEGETVAWNSYWQRLLQDEDVVVFTPPTEAPAPPRAKTDSDKDA